MKDGSKINRNEIDFIKSKLQDPQEPIDQKSYWERDLFHLKRFPSKYWNEFALDIEPKDEDERERHEDIKFMQTYWSIEGEGYKIEMARNPCDFCKGDYVQNIYDDVKYEIIEPDKNGMAKLRRMDNDIITPWNAQNNKMFIYRGTLPQVKVFDATNLEFGVQLTLF